MAFDAEALWVIFNADELWRRGIWRRLNFAWQLTQGLLTHFSFCMAFDALFVCGIWRTFCAWHLTQINFTCQLTQIYVHGNWRRIFFFQNFFWIFFFYKIFFQIFFWFYFSNFLFKFFLNFFFFLATVKLSNSLLCKYIFCLKSFWKLTFFQHFLGCYKSE